MWKNYFKTAWRNIWKNGFYTGLNIAGLAIGMAACIVILSFVFYEKNFDKQHTKNIYRLDEVQKFEGMVAAQKVALSMFPMGPTLKQEFPEVINFTRVRQAGAKTVVGIADKRVTLKDVKYVDSTFFQLFDFHLVQGDRNTVLHKPNSAVITKEAAKKLFGNENPMGKTLTRYASDTILLTVTGVLENIPSNSHLQFDALISFSTIYRPDMMENWGGNWLVTYLHLSENADVAAMEKKFPAFLKRHLTKQRAKFYELFLQPLQAVHGGSSSITHDYQNHQKFDSTYTYIFTVIALIVLIIACINFMNLSTARSAGRAREVGIRKSIGARRFELAGQFIGESVLLCFIAMVIAVILVKISLPFIASFSERELVLPLLHPGVLLMLLSGTLIIGALSGVYPAFYLSSFQPVKVLKGSIQLGKNKGMLRNILVVGQFSGAIVLIIATVLVLQQLRFMQQKDPGFIRDQVVLLPLNSQANKKYEAIKQELLNSTLVSAVTATQQRLGNNLHQTGVVFHGDGPALSIATSQVVVDPDFLNLYKIKLVAGRNFSKDYATDNGKAYIINESMARELLKDKPKAPVSSLLGKMYGFGGLDSSGSIVGIAQDFNFNSLHHKIETLTIFNQRDWGFSELSVRINGSKAEEAIAHMQAVWKKLLPDQEFEYSFLDEHFNQLYKADAQVSKIVGALATLAIIIACLGLFGLASYAAEKRMKEIGIRKVLGASVKNVVGLLSRDFVKLVLIANLIAWPIAWYALNRWLQDFAYRIDINWWVFVMAGVTAILIALFTVSFQAIKAAIANPVKSLRTE